VEPNDDTLDLDDSSTFELPPSLPQVNLPARDTYLEKFFTDIGKHNPSVNLPMLRQFTAQIKPSTSILE
jgi:hypothetical protein